ncbi:hypothetical protein XENORESO_013890 [Xenotaenia resolanae]|uniref:Uncharacterized protein n=1 Tax=Xenotaenia resolanae TaxID=208358 RepID=A0ABV0WR20_9TELE
MAAKNNTAFKDSPFDPGLSIPGLCNLSDEECNLIFLQKSVSHINCYINNTFNYTADQQLSTIDENLLNYIYLQMLADIDPHNSKGTIQQKIQIIFMLSSH